MKNTEGGVSMNHLRFLTIKIKIMKRFFILGLLLTAQISLKAQLIIYSNYNQTGNQATCAAQTIYTGATIPNRLDDSIKSIKLSKGYMAVLAENADGSGEGFSYIASVSDLSANLASVLQNKISFIRVLPFADVKKKGVGSKDNDLATALKANWLYDWGAGDESIPNREYVPMSWGGGGASDANINLYIPKPAITNFLAFNEPDNINQSNIAFATAVPLYKKLLRTGYRMGSPATTEAQYNNWLLNFTNLANQEKARIDFVAVHWYDWGNWTTSMNPNAAASGVFTRFKNYITAVYNLYQKPIWITEFNANPNRVSAVHEEFMALALPWLESEPRVERYAYFFPNAVPAASGSILTALGQIYSNHVSTSAYPDNIYDKRATTVAVPVSESHDSEDNSLFVYPTISRQNKINVTFKKVSDTAQIKIYTMTGQLVSIRNIKTGSSAETIDLSTFTEGVYLLILQDKGSMQSRRFIKQ